MVSWTENLFGTKHRPQNTYKDSLRNASNPLGTKLDENRDDYRISERHHTTFNSQVLHYSAPHVEMVINEQDERDFSEAEIGKIDPIGPFHAPIKPLVIDPNYAALHRQAIQAINDRNYDILMECVKKNPDIILYPCHKQDMMKMRMIHGAHGGTLLHLLASDKPKLKVGTGNKNQEYEMHIISNVRRKHFYLVTKLKPEALWTLDDDERLPLHRAIMAHATTLHEIYAALHNVNGPAKVKVPSIVNKQLNVIELLLNQYPSAATIADSKGNLPLHYAMNFPPDVVKPLRASSDSLLQEKAFPTLKKLTHVLKYLSSLGSLSSAEILYMLVDAFPEGLVKRNKMLDTPIHVLCSKGPMINLTSLEVLLYAHCNKKMSLINRNSNDDQPLHLAIKTLTPLEAIKQFAIVERIFHNNLSLFSQREARGCTPLILALQSTSAQTSLSLVPLMLETAPSITIVPDEQGLLPIVHATRMKLPENIVRIMLEHDMPIELGLAAKRDDGGNNGYGNIVLRLHHHSFWHVSVSCEDRYLEMIRSFLVESATLLQLVALTQQIGPDGVSVLINSVSSTYRCMLRSLLILCHRYEIQTSHISEPFTLFAIDHGLKNSKSDKRRPKTEIRKVLIRCYLYKDAFSAEKNIRKDFQLSSDFIEQVVDYHANNSVETPLKLSLNEGLYFISFERPFHTLEQVFTVVAPWERTGLWFTKCAIVIGQLLTALQHLHERELVHGNLEPSSIGKYGNTWKLMNVGLSAKVGDPMRGGLRPCAPPESIVVDQEKEESSPQQNTPSRVQFASIKTQEGVDGNRDDDETVEESRYAELSCCIVNLSTGSKKGHTNCLVFSPGTVQVSWDIWSLGLILAQLFLGSSPYLPNFEKSKDAHMRNLKHFHSGILQKICDQIGEINEDAADLVGKLLHPDPTRRPTIKDIQRHRYFSTNQCNCFVMNN